MKNKQAALIAITGGVAIFGIKLLAYFLSNSVALLSDALESIVNISASTLMLFSVYISEKPADNNHNYGHQKVEEISSMLEGLFIIAAAFLIVYTAAGRLFETPRLLELNLAISVSIVATIFNGGLSWFLRSVALKSGSSALEGDSKHLLSDVISSAGVWVGLFVVQLTAWGFMDSLLAFAVSILIARMGLKLVLKSSSHLMDEYCEKEEEKICEVLHRHKSKIIDFHNLRTRRHGNQIFAEMHLIVDSYLSVKEAHDLTDHLQEELREELPAIRLTIHIEPKE
ncbi:MAG: Cation transporter [Thermoproteota archaeon]|nr:Cation transporter [Thermoproteota archaeon]